MNRGVVRIYTQQADGRLVERFNLYGREPDAERGARGGFGVAVSNAGDVNGDGREDLIVLHSGTYGGAGAEVVLGRADDAMGRVQVACGDPAEAPWWPSRSDGAGYFSAAGLGDIDGDGCADVAVGMLGGQKTGTIIRFGFGPRCARGHTAPFDLTLVVEQLRLNDNRVGDVASRANDDYDRVPLTLMGALVAGPGDVTGDGVPDLLLRVASWALGDDSSDPAVEVDLGRAARAILCPIDGAPRGARGPSGPTATTAAWRFKTLGGGSGWATARASRTSARPSRRRRQPLRRACGSSSGRPPRARGDRVRARPSVGSSRGDPRAERTRLQIRETERPAC